jgi:phosphoribosylformimino-5-aminoimidazole carboxamide ribotide isomerase
MRIIAAIDIIDGNCVRLTKGDYNAKKVYNEDPLEVAREIEDNGLKYLHLVDLDGARNKRIINYRILERISAKTGLSIDFGGGIRSDEDLRIAFNCGASQVTGGSIAVRSPSVFLDWLVIYGPDKIILGADSRNRQVAINGWSENSGEDIIDFISGYASKGVKYSICTDVEKDGTLKGPSTELYKKIIASVKISLIASGGISSIKDLETLADTGCEGAIIGKAVYEGKIKLKDLKDLC